MHLVLLSKFHCSFKKQPVKLVVQTLETSFCDKLCWHVFLCAYPSHPFYSSQSPPLSSQNLSPISPNIPPSRRPPTCLHEVSINEWNWLSPKSIHSSPLSQTESITISFTKVRVHWFVIFHYDLLTIAGCCRLISCWISLSSLNRRRLGLFFILLS